MEGYWVILETRTGGELHRRFAISSDQAATIAIEMIRDAHELVEGDSIRIEEGWTEDDGC